MRPSGRLLRVFAPGVLSLVLAASAPAADHDADPFDRYVRLAWAMQQDLEDDRYVEAVAKGYEALATLEQPYHAENPDRGHDREAQAVLRRAGLP